MLKKSNSSFEEISQYLSEIDELLEKTKDEEKEIPFIVKDEMEKVMKQEHIDSEDETVMDYEKNLIAKYRVILQERREKLENARKQLQHLSETFFWNKSLS